MFVSDEAIAALLRESTAFKEAGDMGAAVASLQAAKALMLQSSTVYPAETWCKLPLYLQQAGLYEDALVELQFLLDDLPRRARHDSRLDDPNVGPLEGKKRNHQRTLVNDAQVIEAKKALIMKRQAKQK